MSRATVPADKPASEGGGIFVLGMHRGGTSALAGAIGKLGVPLGESSAIKPASPSNELGFWELEPLTRFNDELLAALGGSWASPPQLPEGWHLRSELEPFRDRAAQLFATLHTTPHWVWKDPRNCLLLPFWLAVLDVEPLVMIAYRNPLEVHRSLAQRDGLSKPLAVALWERHLRAALFVAQGKRVLISHYGRLVSDPAGGSDQLAAFLLGNGVPVEDGGRERAARFLTSDLRHARSDEAETAGDPDLSEPQTELLAVLTRLQGGHDPLQLASLPPETPQTEVLLSARRDADLKLFAAREEIRAQAARHVVLRRKLAQERERTERFKKKLREERQMQRRDGQDRLDQA